MSNEIKTFTEDHYFPLERPAVLPQIPQTGRKDHGISVPDGYLGAGCDAFSSAEHGSATLRITVSNTWTKKRTTEG
jgi:hypothetical protein